MHALRQTTTLVVCFGATLATCATREPVDLLVTGAAIYTLDAERPWAEAMALRDGRILALGSDAELRARFVGTERDVGGAMVVPGFHDAHVHPIGAGIDLQRCDLSDSETIDELIETLEECHARDPGDHWLLGRGWPLSLFVDGNPHKALLDRVSATRPILLEAADGHSSWANSAALRLAGIDAATADPPLGVIERDADGAPSGTFRESAEALLWSLVPEPTPAESEDALRRAVEILNGFGVTSIIEANATLEDLATYRALDSAGELDLRVVVSLGTPPIACR